MSAVLLHGDCLERLRTLESNSLDSLVTDPPAGIGFMGKGWDSDKGGRDAWVSWLSEVMRECLRVLKPGAHGLVWAIPRTSHWTAMALEDAGFEVRDCVTHLFGQGFPKSMNIGNGWGTALKPAVEFWWLVRKPLGEKTVAANVLKHGTGGINVDGCRISTSETLTSGRHVTGAGNGPSGYRDVNRSEYQQSAFGRFPANLVLSCCGSDPCEEECAVRMLDEQSGTLRARGNKTAKDHGANYDASSYAFGGRETGFAGDSGGASRFFYVAKASKSDRNRKAKP